MRGYAKIKGNNSFSQNSKFKKEYPFLDVDFDDAYSSKPQENEQKPNIIIKDDKNKKNSFFVENSDEHVDEEAKNEGERHAEGVLRRNYTISSSSSTSSSLAYQKNGKSENLERQSSRKAIQKAVKRAFSTRRSCSVNSSRYCRIYDQPKNVRDFDYNNNNNNDYGNNESLMHNRRHDQDNDDDEYEIESNDGSMETNYTSLKKNKDDYEINNNISNGKVKVGSKVAKACKRLFSR